MEMINVLNKLTELSKENDSPDVAQAIQNTKKLVGESVVSITEEHVVQEAPEERCMECGMMESQCQCDESQKITEKWGTPTKVSPSEKGKYAGKNKEELLNQYNALKKTGPHKKGSKEYGRMRELSFAIRAKGGWGKVQEVITKNTPAGEIISDFQKSKDPRFTGKSKAQRKKQALGAYYGMHPEKSRKVKETKLTPKQQKFAALAKPADKITYADKIAGARKSSKLENVLMREGVESKTAALTEGTMAHGIFSRKKSAARRSLISLRELLDHPLPAGEAGNMLYGLVFDDDLFDRIDEIKDKSGPEADVRMYPQFTGKLKELISWAKSELSENALSESADLTSMKKLAGLNECGMMGSVMGSHTPANISINASAASGSEVASMMRDLMRLAGGETAAHVPQIAVMDGAACGGMEEMVDEAEQDGHFADATTEPAEQVFDENPVVSMTGKQVQTPNGNARQNDNPLEESLWKKYQVHVNEGFDPESFEGSTEVIWIGDDGEEVEGYVNYTATPDPQTGHLHVKLTGGDVTGNNIAAKVDDYMIQYLITDPDYSAEYQQAAEQDAQAQWDSRDAKLHNAEDPYDVDDPAPM